MSRTSQTDEDVVALYDAVLHEALIEKAPIRDLLDLIQAQMKLEEKIKSNKSGVMPEKS
jgi:hypothetical protein